MRLALISTHGYVAASPPLGAADTGGQVVYVLELAKRLAEAGHAVDIWTRRFEDQPAEEPVAPGVRIRRAPCGGSNFIPKEYLEGHLGEWAAAALRTIRREELRYAAISSHYWDGGLAGQRLAEALDLPHHHTPHSLGEWKRRQMAVDTPLAPGEFERRYNFSRRIAAETALYASCRMLVATSEEQAALLREHYGVPAPRLRLIPPGYDERRFFRVTPACRERIRRRLGWEGKVVLAVGRLARNKGYDLLIDAFAAIARRQPDIRLCLAAGGAAANAEEVALREGLRRRAARAGMLDRIRFASFIPDAELADHYRAADAFVLCSRYEPFGMAAVEAMACGTPTVITEHGGLHRMLAFGRDALFADPFDSHDLAVTLAKLLRYEALQRTLARFGAATARRLFTWTGVAAACAGLMAQEPEEEAAACPA